MVNDTILGPFSILPARPNLPQGPDPASPVTADPPSSPPRPKANPFILFLILILLLASQGLLAVKQNAKLNQQDEPRIS